MLAGLDREPGVQVVEVVRRSDVHDVDGRVGHQGFVDPWATGTCQAEAARVADADVRDPMACTTWRVWRCRDLTKLSAIHPVPRMPSEGGCVGGARSPW